MLHTSLIRYSTKTAEQNFMKLSEIVHYMMPYCTSYFKFLLEWFLGFPEQNKDLPYKTWGSGGIILWALLTVFLVYLVTLTWEFDFLKTLMLLNTFE